MKGTKSAILLTFVALLFTTGLFAQRDFTNEADVAYQSESYYEAVDLYKKAYSKEKDKAEKIRIVYRIGDCYRRIENAELAEEWLSKAERAKYTEQETKVYLYLADVMRIQGKYTEAKEKYQKYMEVQPDDPRGQEGVRSCELAEKWTDNPSTFIVENVSQLNSKQFDYSPVITGRKNDDIIFVSSRPDASGNEIDMRSGEGFTDIFTAEMDRKGKWSIPKAMPEPISTEYNEGPVTVTKKDKEMYYTHCPINKNKYAGCKIWKATKRGTEWAEPVQVDFFADTISVGHPSISKDDQMLFFSADAPGGKGGKDIWFVVWDKTERAWGAPQNVAGINTPDDELFPFIKDDGTLYFSSNGHAGMGGMDIFKAEQVGKNEWGNVENMLPPINSASHDHGIFFLGNQNKGYFASNRPEGKGGSDIYSFKMPPVIYTLSGTVRDVQKDCKKPIVGAVVKLIGTDGSSVETLTNEAGEYLFDKKENAERYLLENTSYTIIVSKSSSEKLVAPDCSAGDTEFKRRGYLRSKGQETTVGVGKSTAFVHDFELQCFNCGEIKFKTVLYKLGDDQLMITDQVNSADSLDDLYQTLVDNPNIVIQLQAHTDFRGSAEANQDLSERRAQTCVDYLISKGIDAERLEPKGFGEDVPVEINGQSYDEAFINGLATKEEKEAAHQANRRTVFIVLRDDFEPKPKEEGEGQGAGEGTEGAGGSEGGN
ncbi:OmpA family protein [bacterium SCSIO 12741]|nr:OmpA family protein [bacterium SCSIO 12741]